MVFCNITDLRKRRDQIKELISFILLRFGCTISDEPRIPDGNVSEFVAAAETHKQLFIGIVSEDEMHDSAINDSLRYWPNIRVIMRDRQTGEFMLYSNNGFVPLRTLDQLK